MRTVCHSVGCAMGSLPLRMRESPLWMCPDNVHPMLREAEGKGVLGSRERAGRGQGEGRGRAGRGQGEGRERRFRACWVCQGVSFLIPLINSLSVPPYFPRSHSRSRFHSPIISLPIRRVRRGRDGTSAPPSCAPTRCLFAEASGQATYIFF